MKVLGHCCTFCQGILHPLVKLTVIVKTLQGGANVILLARRADALSRVSDACVAAHKESGLQQGGKFASVQLDVSDNQQIASLWTKVPQDLRDVDILGKFITSPFEDRFELMLFFKVNNAGYVLGVEHVGDINDKDIEGMFTTNVFGLIAMTQLLVKGPHR